MKNETFLLEDYKLKAAYLTQHFSRMWTRFNFFLAIQSALFVLSLDKDILNISTYVGLLSVAGMILSVAWYYFGAVDNYLVEVYRGQIGLAYHLLQKTLGESGLEELASEEELKTYSYVGDVMDKYFNLDTEEVMDIEQNRWQRRVRSISATELAVVFPAGFFVLWLLRLGVSFFVG